MANGHGGYRAPLNPSAVSGPGSLSQRTDGAMPADPARAGHGENQDMAMLQEGGGGAAPGAIDPSGLVPLEAATQYPDRPVTDGGVFADEGSYPGEQEDNLRLGAHLRPLKRFASTPSASNALRQYVRHLEAQVRRTER